MATTGLTVNFRSSFGTTAAQVHCLFAGPELATAAQQDLHDAAKAYHDRANDREKFATVETLLGRVSIDVSEIVSIGVDDALGDNRDRIEEWHKGLSEIRAAGEAAGNAIHPQSPKAETR